MNLLVVGDGELDARTLPSLIRMILGRELRATTRNWRELHLLGGNGYAKKLQYLAKECNHAGLDGVVAVVDRDKDAKSRRIQDLRRGREESLSRPPIAIGQADPHGEAWLLDDPVAVARTLRLDSSTPVPSVSKSKSPKDELNALHAISPRATERRGEVLGEIAAAVQLKRCTHAKSSGLAAFADDLRAEFPRP